MWQGATHPNEAGTSTCREAGDLEISSHHVHQSKCPVTWNMCLDEYDTRHTQHDFNRSDNERWVELSWRPMMGTLHKYHQVG